MDVRPGPFSDGDQGLRMSPSWRACSARGRRRSPRTTPPRSPSSKLTGGATGARRPRPANHDVRAAITCVAAGRGAHSFLAYKVKAHTTEAQATPGLITSAFLREHDEVADLAAKGEVVAPCLIPALCEGHGWPRQALHTFLEGAHCPLHPGGQRGGGGLQEDTGGRGPSPRSILGRRRLARAEAITLDLSSRPPSGKPTSPVGVAAGPLPKSRWHRDTVLFGELRAFWSGRCYGLDQEAKGAPRGLSCGSVSRSCTVPARAPQACGPRSTA